jgi:uncharacterized protein (UPF0335 family)
MSETKTVNGIDGSHLKNYVERIEKLEADKKAISDDIKEVFAEAKGFGYDPKIMREILKLRKLDDNELYEKESMIEIYKTALGMEETELASEENLNNKEEFASKPAA